MPRAPAHLVDANIFSPERGTLAFSETLIAPALVAAPLQWAGVGPILIYTRIPDVVGVSHVPGDLFQ